MQMQETNSQSTFKMSRIDDGEGDANRESADESKSKGRYRIINDAGTRLYVSRLSCNDLRGDHDT